MEMGMNIANLSLDSVGEKAQGINSVNKHRKSARGRRKGKGGGYV